MTLPAYVQSSTFTDSAASSTTDFSQSYDSGSSGANRCLVIIVGAIRDNGASAFAEVTSATYGGQAMTIQKIANYGTGAQSPDLTMLVLPLTTHGLTGANTLAINFANAHDSYSIIPSVYQHVDQTTPIVSGEDDASTNAASATTLTDLSVTTGGVDRLIIVGMIQRSGVLVFTPEGSGTKREEADSGNVSSEDNRTCLIDYAAATADTYSDDATIVSSSRLTGCMIALNSAGEAAPITQPAATMIGL